MDRPELVGGVVWCLAGLSISVYTVLSLRIGSFHEPGPGFFPLVAGIALTCLASFQLLLVRRGSKKEAMKKTIAELWHSADWKKVCYIIVSLLVSYIVFKTAGFLLTVVCLMSFLLAVIGGKTWKYAFGLAVLISACSYALFYYVLQVELPMGILGF